MQIHQMKDKILELVAKKPKHYSKIVQSDSQLLEWVKSNTLTPVDHMPTMIFSAVYQQSGLCSKGQYKKVQRWSTGFTNCGPAAICDCTKKQISYSVAVAKQSTSKEEKINTNQKRAATMIKKYGVAYNSQRLEINHIWKKPKIADHILKLLNDKEWLYQQYIVKDLSAVDIASSLGVYYSTVIEYCKKHKFKIKQRSQYSLIEKQIGEFIASLGIAYETNNRTVLGKKEIDIFLPEFNFAIEVNGLYWHSYDFKTNEKENKTRHLDKTLLAVANGIDLIHITDWEWQNKKSIIQSLIRTKLQLNQKIYARNTISKLVDSAQARQFLNENHIQGECYSTFYAGLYHEGQLVMLISAGPSRFDQTNVEIHRIAAKQNISVVGGASKLLKFLLKISNYQKIIAYCDQDRSNGRVYQALGFTLVKHTGPGYFWTNGTEMFSRYRCQKSKLKNWLPSFDQTKSESENMFANGYRRYWTCGNLVFEYSSKS